MTTGRPEPTTAIAVQAIVTGIVFFAVALVPAAMAWHLIQHERWRAEHALHLPGTVLGLVTRCEARSAKWEASCAQHVSVRFTDVDGRERQFVNKPGSQHPTEAPGDPVTVIYDVGDRAHAAIESPLTKWFVPAIPSALALVFGLFAMNCIVRNVILWRDRRWLGVHGVHVEAGDITVIRIVTKNTRSHFRPFVVVAQWRNPRDASRREFRSDPLDYDPTALVRSRPTIGVLIDPDRPSRYWMEIGLRPPPGTPSAIWVL